VEPDLAPEQELLAATVRRFVRQEIWLQENRIDGNAFALPPDVGAALGSTVRSMGLPALREPESLDGPPLDLPARVLLWQELAPHRAGLRAPGYGLFGLEVPVPLYAVDVEQQT
jgi:alkylation response protein AidB-like acyl-CoA dehydrogenase